MISILNVSFDYIKPNVCVNNFDEDVNFLFMKIDGKAVFRRIEDELEAKEKSREWFCVQVGYSKEDYSQNWNHWKNRGFPKSRLLAASDALGLTTDWLVSETLPKYKTEPHDKNVMELPDNSVSTDKSINSQVDSHEFTALSQENPPMLKGEKAINWRESIEQYQLGTDEGMIKNIPITPNTFGFDVVGDEMAPDFKDGARVSIDPDKRPEDLKCALVEIDGDLAIRRLRRINGEWWLTLANPAYADMKKPLSEARFIGMVTSKVEVTIY